MSQLEFPLLGPALLELRHCPVSLRRIHRRQPRDEMHPNVL